MLRRLTALTLLLLLLSVPASGGPGDDLRSKDVNVRLAAIEALVTAKSDGAEKLLLDRLGDSDWEVIERAATALGRLGGPDSVKPLAELAVEGPIRRVRSAAVDALAELDRTGGIERIAKRTTGKKGAVEAFEALARLSHGVREEVAAKAVAKGLALSVKESELRSAAARGLPVLPPNDGAEALTKLLSGPEYGVTASALDAVIAWPDATYVPALLDALADPDMPDVIERRVLAALVAVPRAARAEGRDALVAAGALLRAQPKGGTVLERQRLARLVGLLGQAPAPAEDGKEAEQPLVPSVDALLALDAAFANADPAVRATAAHALGRIGSEGAMKRAAALAKSDADPRVRLHALRAVLANGTADEKPVFDLADDRLTYDPDLLVREEAAVALGRKGLGTAVDILSKTFKVSQESPTTHWALGTCAAVSLGLTRDPAAVAPLAEGLASKDWRLRASAVVGLGHVSQHAAVPHLIGALDAKTAAERSSAFEALRRLTTQSIGNKSKDWRAWWDANKSDYVFVDREEEARKAKKYGYAPTNVGVYEGLDVVVLQSRGDSIEKLLTKLEIGHRLTRQGAVPDAGLNPWGLFVANCTGEVRDEDMDQLQWFVRAGGYLFCSCWALKHTAERVYPALPGYTSPMRRLVTKGQVLDNVIAEACPTESPYLDQVFDGVTRPIYVLYGAFVIEVLDPERAEVLIDSPDCATRWGGGNLAAWYSAGHGVVLDSSNHFDLQGLEKADGVNKPEELMAYAADHMGLGYAELREFREAGFWKSKAKAHEAARDLSAFRFITNFVRAKRRQDD